MRRKTLTTLAYEPTTNIKFQNKWARNDDNDAKQLCVCAVRWLKYASACAWMSHRAHDRILMRQSSSSTIVNSLHSSISWTLFETKANEERKKVAGTTATAAASPKAMRFFFARKNYLTFHHIRKCSQCTTDREKALSISQAQTEIILMWLLLFDFAHKKFYS